MRSLRTLTLLLVVLVLVPAGILAWLGFQSADAYDAAIEDKMRRDLDDAEIKVRKSFGRQVEALEARLQSAVDQAARSLAVWLPTTPTEEAFQRFQDGWDLGWKPVTFRLLSGDGRAIYPVEFVPDDELITAPTTDALMADLRLQADRLAYGKNDVASATALWRAAAAKLPTKVLRAAAEAEGALMAGRESPNEAVAAAHRLMDEWGSQAWVDLGRPFLRLMLLASTTDSEIAERLRLAEWHGLLNGAPITAEERARARIADSTLRREETAWQARTTWVHRTAEVSHGVRLEVVVGSQRDSQSGKARVNKGLLNLDEQTIGRVRVRYAPIDLRWPIAPDSMGSAEERVILVEGLGGYRLPILLDHLDASSATSAKATRRVLTTGGVISLFLLTAVGLALVRRALAREQAARRLRDEFIANVTHEIRTPLTSVVMHSEMLAEEGMPPERRRETARIVEAEGARLAALVDDLLDFAALERGARRLEPEPVDVAAAVRQVAAPWKTLAEREQVDLHVDAPEPPLPALADPHALSRMLANLIANAWKHGRPSRRGGPGRITVRARLLGGKPAVEVRDDGPGIPNDERGRVFERFHRGRQAGGKEGTGIGLALSRDLARAMGGDLVVVQDPEETVFLLTLPPAPETAP